MVFSGSGRVVCDGNYCVLFGLGYSSMDFFFLPQLHVGLTSNWNFMFESGCLNCFVAFGSDCDSMEFFVGIASDCELTSNVFSGSGPIAYRGKLLSQFRIVLRFDWIFFIWFGFGCRLTSSGIFRFVSGCVWQKLLYSVRIGLWFNVIFLSISGQVAECL